MTKLLLDFGNVYNSTDLFAFVNLVKIGEFFDHRWINYFLGFVFDVVDKLFFQTAD